MAQADIPPPSPPLDGSGLAIGIVVARYNWHITGAMFHCAQEELKRLGVATEDMRIVYTPGAFELATVAQAMLLNGRYDALICFGCVMRGETRHDIVVGDAAAQGIQRVALELHTPIIFGVMTVENLHQAQARITRGKECAQAAVEMARTIRTIKNAR
ncbi:MAG TPA: 6,7-dimethyl-8-ribityllumazine synthase [Ktedonosporobacter sp.]|jgi:6,7-dimethyl-8-ribityllumazine synthase|nr:6,7-dimethyl-8-ribityllumazine synthase [Ktedonosporobacter sp.]